MKRQCLWVAAVFVGAGATIANAAGVSHLAWNENGGPTEIEAGSPSDVIENPPAAPLPPMPPRTSAAPIGYHSASAPMAAAGCACDDGVTGCCKREFSPLDGVWGGYCAEKACADPTHTCFDLLHLKPFGSWDCCPPQHCSTAPPACHEAPACGPCHGRRETFGLPKLRLPKLFCAPPAPVGSCATPTHRPWNTPRAWGLRQSPTSDCAACEAGDDVSAQGAWSQPEAVDSPVVIEAPAPSDLPEVSPPGDITPELPPAELPDEEDQGWLPLPRFQPTTL